MVQIPLTPDRFAALAAELQQKHGIALTGDQGTLTKSGVTASYVYAAEVLTVTILEKPFFVSTQFCEDQLKSFLGS